MHVYYVSSVGLCSPWDFYKSIIVLLPLRLPVDLNRISMCTGMFNRGCLIQGVYNTGGVYNAGLFLTQGLFITPGCLTWGWLT